MAAFIYRLTEVCVVHVPGPARRSGFGMHQRTDHIACSSTTMSEVVVPIMRQSDGALVAVLDIDSDQPDIFDDDDMMA